MGRRNWRPTEKVPALSSMFLVLQDFYAPFPKSLSSKTFEIVVESVVEQ